MALSRRVHVNLHQHYSQDLYRQSSATTTSGQRFLSTETPSTIGSTDDQLHIAEGIEDLEAHMDMRYIEETRSIYSSIHVKHKGRLYGNMYKGGIAIPPRISHLQPAQEVRLPLFPIGFRFRRRIISPLTLVGLCTPSFLVH